MEAPRGSPAGSDRQGPVLDARALFAPPAAPGTMDTVIKGPSAVQRNHREARATAYFSSRGLDDGRQIQLIKGARDAGTSCRQTEALETPVGFTTRNFEKASGCPAVQVQHPKLASRAPGSTWLPPRCQPLTDRETPAAPDWPCSRFGRHRSRSRVAQAWADSFATTQQRRFDRITRARREEPPQCAPRPGHPGPERPR